MAYVSDFTGGNADDRRAEADRILKIIENDIEQLATNQQRFVEQMAEGGHVSGKQLLWLRDIKDGML
jgi:hypothetical protein